MTIAKEGRWTPLPVPWAVTRPDRVPKQRYYDAEFFAMEAELFWPRVWQMACRLEEIPQPGDFAEYEILDQSIIVVRTTAEEVKAYYNACRHRGVKLVEGHGSSESGFVCSFHGWCYGLDGANTFVLQPEMLGADSLRPDEIALTPVRCEVWGGCAWINLDDGAPPLRDCLEPYATVHEAWKAESLQVEWWEACRLPANWKLAMAAFMEGWHVPETHPQLLSSARARAGYGAADGRAVVDMVLYSMRQLSVGMAGMTHEIDVRIAEGLRDIELPADPQLAAAAWRSTLNDAVVRWWRANGHEIADLNELDRIGLSAPIWFCFPHTFILPTYSSASAYRFRPLGPEETLMEIWSLTRFPEGSAPRPRPRPPAPRTPDDPGWPPIPGQDFSNIPKQQRGLHNRGFQDMRLAERVEGLISNFERVVDGFLAGLPHEQLLPAIRQTHSTIDVPIADLTLSR
ncbi:MAG TPA: aromatic ring-hydroxylating dioxygenase subunit alpha [Acidimicrobiales bacterium]|nr:aromatic ring-hydroxylating dioxygenase subunit alpha [Acidimicrobiales bacterium]